MQNQTLGAQCGHGQQRLSKENLGSAMPDGYEPEERLVVWIAWGWVW